MNLNYLKQQLRVYKKMYKKITKLKPAPKRQKFDVGDIICIYGEEDFVYAVVVAKTNQLSDCVLLTPELILAGDGLIVKVDHFVSALRVTPINFYVTDDIEQYCEVVARVDVQKVLESHNQLKQREYHGVRKKFWQYETERIELLYSMFFNFLNRMEEQPQPLSITLRWDDISSLFDENDLKKLFPEVAVAQSVGTRQQNLVVLKEGSSIKIIFPDELIGKNGKLLLLGKTIHSGPIPVDLRITFEKAPPAEVIKDLLQILIDEDSGGEA